MNMNAALDVATGLVLMYLVLSLFCTTINELITTAVSLRARTLKKTLQQLIDDPRLKTLFYDHGLIDGCSVAVSGGNKSSSPTAAPSTPPAPAAGLLPLAPMIVQPTPPAKRAGDAWYAFSHPSYLSGKTVAAAMVGSLLDYVEADKAMPVDATFDQLKAAIQRLPLDSNIRDTLSACLIDADKSIDKFRAGVATWFDNSMDRLSGSYKRNLQIISFLVGLVIACAVNADSLNVAGRLWRDQTLSNVIARSAANFAQQGGTADAAVKANPSCQPQPNGQLPADEANHITNSITTLCALNAELRPFPIGWSTWPSCGEWLWKIIGLLITTIALTMGAPFWFDLLQKFVNFRATGKKPDPVKTPI